MKHSFKPLIIAIISLFLAQCAAYANDGRQRRQGKAGSAEGQVKLQFSNHIRGVHKDSALIIFDRYNHSGAGIIYKVFTLDSNYSVLIPPIPVGKYLILIQCVGVHRDYWEGTAWIRSGKCGTIRIRLEKSEEFTKASVVIPDFRPDPMKLSIIRVKARGGSRQHKSFPVF